MDETASFWRLYARESIAGAERSLSGIARRYGSSDELKSILAI